MRILIDECIDEGFRDSLTGHDRQSARCVGLAQLETGRLVFRTVRSWLLGEGQATAWGGDGAAKFLGGFDPFLDDDFYVGESFLVGLSVGGAAGKFGDFDRTMGTDGKFPYYENLQSACMPGSHLDNI